MGKMNELSALADEIREMGEKLTRMSGQIRDLFTGQEDDAQESTQITLEEVRAVLARKTRVSKENTEAIRNLLKKHGAERLSQIPQEEYAAVLKEAEVIPDA